MKDMKWRKVGVAGTAFIAILATLLPTSIANAEVTKITIQTNQSPWVEAYKKLILDYTKETGVQVDVRVLPYPEMRPALVADIQASNRTYDVYQYDELFAHEFAANKWVKPFKQVDPNFKLDPNIGSYGNFMYWNAAKKFSDPNGDVMSMPLNGNTNVFLYRKDIYEKLDLKVPTTWDEALANAAKIKDANLVKYPYVMRTQAAASGSSVTYDYTHILASYGGKYFNKEGEDWNPVVNSKEGLAAATTMRALVKYGPSATNTIGQAQVIAAMLAGDAAQGHTVFAAANQMNNPALSKVAGKIGFAVMPKGCATCNPGIVSGTFALSVPVGLTPEREKAAYNYITWIESKKAQITQTVINDIAKQANMAGWTLEDALKETIVRNWQSFKADWVASKTTFAQQVADIARTTVPGKKERDPALVKLDQDKLITKPPSLETLQKIAMLRTK